jgi:pimeloyl-ACP methyl ester carboxylesterase
MTRVYVPEEGVLFVEANGLEFGYFEEGEGPLVLMLHGFPDSPHTWDDLRPALAREGYRVVTPFLRGYAPTQKPAADAYDYRALGEDVVALVEALGEERAHLVGHDWGASAAYAAASLAPERFTSLTTIAIPHPGFFVPDRAFFERASHFLYLAQPDAEDLMRADDFAHVDELYARWSPTWDLPEGETQPVKNLFSAPGALDAALGYYRDATPIAPEFMRQPITVATITIAGADDGVTLPESFESTVDGFDGGWTLHTFSGGHFVHRENPSEVLAAMLDHMSSSSTR